MSNGSRLLYQTDTPSATATPLDGFRQKWQRGSPSRCTRPGLPPACAGDYIWARASQKYGNANKARPAATNDSLPRS